MQLVRIAEITGKTPIEICWQVQTVVVRSNSYVVMYMVFKQGFCKTTKKISYVFLNFFCNESIFIDKILRVWSDLARLKIDIWRPTYYSKIQLYHYNWVKIPVHEGIFFWAQQVAKGKKKTVKHEEFIAQQNHSLYRDFNVLRCTLQSCFLKSFKSFTSSTWREVLSNITNIQ